jgi:hypothetical protein
VSYESNLGENGSTWTLSATQTNGENGWSDQRAGVNFNIPFGDKTKKRNYTRPTNGDAGDIGDNLINFARSQQSQKVLGKEVSTETHEARIDKSSLAAGDGIDTNLNGTISSLHFDNGGFTVSSVAGVNDTNYSPFLGIVGGKLALINFKGINNQMIKEGLQTGATKNLRVSVNDTSGVSIYNITIKK